MDVMHREVSGLGLPSILMKFYSNIYVYLSYSFVYLWMDILPLENPLLTFGAAGENHLLTHPLRLPRGCNFVIQGGTLRTFGDFPKDCYLIELCSSSSTLIKTTNNLWNGTMKCNTIQSTSFEDITMKYLMLDSKFFGGGIHVINSVYYISHFITNGIFVQGGRGTYICQILTIRRGSRSQVGVLLLDKGLATAMARNTGRPIDAINTIGMFLTLVKVDIDVGYLGILTEDEGRDPDYISLACLGTRQRFKCGGVLDG
eukprot:Gb_35124 [translate_table: standard]